MSTKIEKASGGRKFSWGRKSRDTLDCNLCDFVFLQKNLNLKNEKDVDEVYDIREKIGAGTFGTVRIGIHKITKQKRAIKNVFKGSTTRKMESQLANEMKILQMISHTNILPLIEYFETNNRVFIVTDVYEGGELFDEIIRRGDFDEKGASIIVAQLISCLSYLATKKVVHRDLKPENILLTKSKDLQAIKVIDFGHAIEFDPDKDNNMVERVGTPFYIAPEVLNGSYDHRIDLWSVGVISYILLCGSPPFGGHDNDEIFERVKKGKYKMKYSPWPEVSDVAKDFVRSILIPDLSKRATLEAIQNHEFLELRNRKLSKTSRGSQNNGASKGKLQKISLSFHRATTNSFEKAKQAMNKRVMKKKESKAVKNLRNFKCRMKFGQVIFAFVVTQCMPKEDKEELAQVFRSWDANNDGLLTREEMSKGIMNNAPKVAKVFDLDHWFNLMDSDGNGYIEYHEFLMIASDAKVMTKKNLQSIFHFLDKDSSGFIEVNEIKEALLEFDNVEDVIKEMLDEVDSNKDGKVSEEEFLQLLNTER